MKKSPAPIILAAVLFIGTLLVPKGAEAIPSFARTMEMACSACHTQWPMLNEFGRNFFQQGFDTADTIEPNENLDLQKNLPLSARFVMRLADIYSADADKTPSESARVRSLHEVEIMAAGRTGQFSYFVELELEDEMKGATDGNEAGSGTEGPGAIAFMGYAGYHISPAINFRFGDIAPLAPDGHETVDRHGIFAEKFTGSDIRPANSQHIVLYGTSGPIFYLAGVHGPDSDMEGHDAGSFIARLAYDTPFGVSIGGWFDSEKPQGIDDKKNRTGFDLGFLRDQFQASILYGMVDDKTSGTSIKDTGLEVFGGYVVSKGESPLVGLSVLWDSWTQTDGDDKYATIRAQVHYFLRENVKIGVVYQSETDKPDTAGKKRDRTWIRIDAGV